MAGSEGSRRFVVLAVGGLVETLAGAASSPLGLAAVGFVHCRGLSFLTFFDEGRCRSQVPAEERTAMLVSFMVGCLF